MVSAAQEIKFQQNELRTAAFTEFRFRHGENVLAFYASFNVETCVLDYNIVQNGFDVKLITDIEPPVFVQFGEFIRLHEAWAAGLSDRPVFESEVFEDESEPE